MGNYYVKPRIYMEREGLREILKGVTRAFIVTDKFMHESGKVSYLTDVLDQMGIAYEDVYKRQAGYCESGAWQAEGTRN